jgi:TRAP-type C4-dicarboxylate transport system substrate-binding protein
MEQIEAIRNNVVQLGFVPTAYYQSLMPEGQAFSLLRLNPMQLRESGFHEFMVDRHERIGVRYLGMWVWTSFYLWSKKPVENMDGLKGLKMRTSALYDRFMKALGIVPVTISSSDTYTALERGTVDGFGWLLLGPRQMGWIETTKYIIDHPFFTMNTVIDMNLSTWNKLPEAVQSKIIKITKAFEPDMVARFDEMTSNEWGKLEAAGVKKIHFSPEEAKKYTNLAYEVEWEALKEKVPDLVPRLKRLTGNE